MLANWMFFWNTVDWVAQPTPPATPGTTNAGSGKGHGPFDEDYRLDDDYWRAREQMLARHTPREIPPATQPGKEKIVAKTVAVHNRILDRVTEGKLSLKKLSSLEPLVIRLSLQIDQFELDSEDEILIALLLS